MPRGAKRSKAKPTPSPVRPRRSRPAAASVPARDDRRLAEALAQQEATSEILRVISQSPRDTQPVFEAIVRNATRLCDAEFSAVARIEDGLLHLAAISNMSPAETAAYHSLFPRPARRDFVIGRAFLEGRPIHVEDVLEDPEYDAHTLEVLQRAASYRSYIGVPIVRQGVTIGAIGCGRHQRKPFTPAQIELVKTFADQAVIAIENVRLFTELQARNVELTESLEQQTATSDILRVISSSPTDVRPVFDAVAESAARLCESFDSAIWRRDGDRLLLVGHHGPIPIGPVGEFALPLIRGTAAGRAVVDVATVHVADMQREVEDFPESSSNAQRMGFRTILCVPLIRKGTAIGCIQLRRTEASLFSERQVALLQTFADQGVIAIENVRLFTEVQERNHALTESLQQQTATSDILRVISSSPTDIQPVFATMARSAATLCEAFDASIFQVDGDRLAFVGHHGPIAQNHGAFSLPLVRGTVGGRSVLEGRPVQVADLQTEEREFPDGVENARRFGFHTILSVPLVRDGVAIGGIQLRRTEVHPFTERHIALLQTFADQAVIAIENVRLFTEVQQRNRALTESLEQQTATGEILRAISSSPTDTRPVFDMIARNARRLCEADSAAVFTYDGALVHLEALDNVGYAGADALREAYPLPATEGHATGRVILQGRPVHIEDAQADRDFHLAGVLSAGVRTVLGVPMMKDGVPVGVIVLHTWSAPRPFSESQIALLETFADQAVIAIQNVRLFTEVQERNQDLTETLEQQTATGEILRAISSSPTDTQPVFEMITRNARRLCAADSCAVFTYDGQLIHLQALDNMGYAGADALRQYYPAPVSQGHAGGRAILQGRPVHIEDTQADSNYVLTALVEAGMRTILAVPMMRDGAAIGLIVLHTWTTARPFSESQIDLLKTFADQAVIAIENVRLFTELEARTAQLTRSVGELRALGEVSQAVGSTLDLDAVLETIVDRAVRLSGSD